MLDEIHRMNSIVDNFHQKANTEEFKQKYAWISLQILATNRAIEISLPGMRLRRIKKDFEVEGKILLLLIIFYRD